MMACNREGTIPLDRKVVGCLERNRRPKSRTKKHDAKPCYVYMVLPGATGFTTAGRFKVAVDRNGDYCGQFIYCRSYLDNPDAVPIDPIQLYALTEKVHLTKMFNGVFSSFRDASPQLWGRRIIELTSPREPRDEIDYLLQSPDDRVGSLGFGRCTEPPAPKRNFHKIEDIGRLAAIAETIVIKDQSIKKTEYERVRYLKQFPTSIGGSVPKAVVEDAIGLWIAKFNHWHDKWNFARVEHAMLELANSCGINSARNRVETVDGRDVPLVERFDRDWTEDGYLRNRMISGFTALRTDRSPESRKHWHYALLAEQLRRFVSYPVEDSKELFKRMAFNALISKSDDGPGSHSMIAQGSEWKLSPAYDLRPSVFHANPERHLLSMNCGIYGRQANAHNLLTECGRFLLGHEEAASIIDTMEKQVSKNWYRIARDAGVSETDCRKISRDIVYAGFRDIPE